MMKKNIIEKNLVILVTIFLVTGSYISILSKSTVDASYPNEDITIKEEQGGSQLIFSNTDQPVSSNTQTNHFFEDEYAKVKINTGTPPATTGWGEVEDNGTEDDIEILTINYNETLQLLSNGTSEMDLSIVVPQSIYAEMYREMLGSPEDIIRGESIPIPLNSTTVSSEKIIISAGRESFYNEIQKIHWYSFGTDISISDSEVIPVGDDDECTVNISGISVLDVNILDGDYWNVGFGPQSTNNLSAVTKYIATNIGFTKLMLNSMEGRQIYKQIWEIRLILPDNATLLNTENLDGKQWLLDFGGGTYLTANIIIENSSTILIKEILIVTENEIIHPTPIGSYKSFEIEMIIPNSPSSINLPLFDNSLSIFEFRTDVINIVNYDETISLPGDYWDADLHLILNLECQGYISDSQAWIEANAYAYAGIQVTFNYNYEYSWEQEVFSSPSIQIWIGPVLILIDGSIELAFSATAEVGSTISASAWADATIRAGVKYSLWEGFDFIWEHNFQKGYELPSVDNEFINFQFTARPSVKFPISVKVYGIIGVEITPEIYLLCTFTWVLNFGGQYDFFWNARLGFTLSVGAVVGIPYIAEKSWDWEILDHTILEWGNVNSGNPDIPIGIDDDPPETWLVMYSPPLYHLGGDNWVTGKYLFFWFEAIEQAGEGIPSGLDKTMFKVNGNPWMEYNYPDLWLAEINEDPGYYYYDIQWYSIDNLGNIEPTNTYQVNAELYPPTSSIDYPSGAIYAHETPITLEGTDDLTGWRIWYRVWYEDSWSEWMLGEENTPVTFYFYGNGENRVEWCAMDGVWNFESIQTHSFNVIPPSGQYFTFSTVGQSDLQEYDDGITGDVSFILSIHNKYTRVIGELSSYFPNNDHGISIFIWDESADEWIKLGSKLIVAGDSSWHAFDYILPSIRSTWLFFSTNDDALTEVRNGCLYHYSAPADASLDLSIMCDWVDTNPENETYGDHGDPETNFDLGEKCWSFSEISNTAQWDVIKWKWKKDGLLRYTGEWTIPQPWNSVICWSWRIPDEAGDWIVEIFYNDDYLGSGPEFTVHGPLLNYAPDSIDFNTQVKGWTGYSTFDVWNDGPGTLTYTISEDIDWIDIGYYDGESNGEHDIIQVNVVNTGSMLGHYDGDIEITSSSGSGTVHVEIDIAEPAPELFVHPTQMYYTVRRDNSKTQQILVKNTGNIDMYWQIQNVSYDWIGSLTFDPIAGTTALGPGAEINVDVIVAIDRWADLGEWNGEFTVHAEGCTDITVWVDIDVLTKWEIQIINVSSTPNFVGFGFNTIITEDVIDIVSGIDTVNVNITYPDSSTGNFTMDNTGNNTYEYAFSDTWLVGQYNYTIWAVDNSGNVNSSSGHSFNISANATVSIATLKDRYFSGEYINITDPPGPPDPPNNDDPYLYWNAPDNSFGISSIKTVNWKYFWQLFNQHSMWDLEAYNPNTEEWVSVKECLTVIRTRSADNSSEKIALDFTAPYSTDYRLTFAIDARVKNYVNRSGQYEYILSYSVGDDETYTVFFNWSDMAAIPGITFKHGMTNINGLDYFYFRARRNNVPKDYHVILDPVFGVTEDLDGSYYQRYTNVIRGLNATCNANGIADNIVVRLKQSGSSKPKVKCALYYVSNGTMIAETEERTVEDGWDEWYAFNLPANITVTEGTNYYICCWANGNLIGWSETDFTRNHLEKSLNYDSVGGIYPSPTISYSDSTKKCAMYCSYTNIGIQSKIKNTGSTDVKGYLLMQVQYYNETIEDWVIDQTPVDDVFQTVDSGTQLALDQFFNSTVNTNDLTFGSGLYRVYAAFCDPDGNVLINDDDTSMNASYEFDYTALQETTHLVGNWNWIALPFNESVDKIDLWLEYNEIYYTWTDAVTEGIITNTLFDWNRETQLYEIVEALSPGYGYWMYAYHNCILYVELEVDENYDDFTTELKDRWNVIGAPYSQSVNKGDLIINYNSTDYSWDDAVTAGIITDTLFGWDGMYVISDVLEPGYGYWMYAYYDCILKMTYYIPLPEISNVVLTHSDPLDTDPNFGWENISAVVVGVVNEVKLIVTDPDDTVTEYPMTNIIGTDTYYVNTTFTIEGCYSYYIWADTVTSSSQQFELPPNYDVDMNGQTHFMDMVAINLMYGEYGPFPGWCREDVDNNGQVHFMDLVQVNLHYGEYWDQC